MKHAENGDRTSVVGSNMIILIGILIVVAMYERSMRYKHQQLLSETVQAFIDKRLEVEQNSDGDYDIWITKEAK